MDKDRLRRAKQIRINCGTPAQVAIGVAEVLNEIIEALLDGDQEDERENNDDR